MRGEHGQNLTGIASVQGSSPHARGARVDAGALHADGGIIPACAGSTRRGAPSRPRRWDHPRMRGEHSARSSVGRNFMGSSPHARGALELADAQGIDLRIIPACAGSTPLMPPDSPRQWDHPRMRGEHPQPPGTRLHEHGSSPHARGAHRRRDRQLGRRGIIPACAGSTSNVGDFQLNRGDHPRMRGEHRVRAAAGLPRRGSSPHARGAQRPRRTAHRAMGIIPACAGSTS